MKNYREDEENFSRFFLNKRIIFVTTKNLDYLRNVQEIELIRRKSRSCKVIGSASKYYFIRLISVYSYLLIHSLREADIIFIGFLPQLVLPIWKWKFKNRQIYGDFFISLYDTLVFDRKKIKEGSFIAEAIKKLDVYTLRKCNKVICDTKCHRDYFAELSVRLVNDFFVLYLRADISIYYRKTIEKSPEWKGKFIVLYFGSVLPLQGVNVVLQCIEQVKEKENIHFIMIGPIKDKIRKDIVSYFEWLSQTELANYIAMSDLCLAGHFSGEIAKAHRTIPGKAYIYEAMGKKMILGENPANRERYECSDTVTYVKMGDAESLASEIRKIKAAATLERKSEKDDKYNIQE